MHEKEILIILKDNHTKQTLTQKQIKQIQKMIIYSYINSKYIVKFYNNYN
jgi:hypothetical protein